MSDKKGAEKDYDAMARRVMENEAKQAAKAAKKKKAKEEKKQKRKEKRALAKMKKASEVRVFFLFSTTSVPDRYL